MVSDNLFINILNILPKEVDCYIQAPSLENKIIECMLDETELDYFQLLNLNSDNRNIVIEEELKSNFSMYIQKIQIKHKGVLLFEGYDGVDYGYISNNLILPEWFKDKHVPVDCMISDNW